MKKKKKITGKKTRSHISKSTWHIRFKKDYNNLKLPAYFYRFLFKALQYLRQNTIQNQLRTSHKKIRRRLICVLYPQCTNSDLVIYKILLSLTNGSKYTKFSGEDNLVINLQAVIAFDFINFLRFVFDMNKGHPCSSFKSQKT